MRDLAINLEGFSAAEETMIQEACVALQGAGHDISFLKVLVRADMPIGYRAMSLEEDGAVLGEAAFASPALLNHVLEEELLHVRQKASGLGQVFQPGTAKILEEALNEVRRFPLPNS